MLREESSAPHGCKATQLCPCVQAGDARTVTGLDAQENIHPYHFLEAIPHRTPAGRCFEVPATVEP